MGPKALPPPGVGVRRHRAVWKLFNHPGCQAGAPAQSPQSPLAVGGAIRRCIIGESFSACALKQLPPSHCSVARLCRRHLREMSCGHPCHHALIRSGRFCETMACR